MRFTLHVWHDNYTVLWDEYGLLTSWRFDATLTAREILDSFLDRLGIGHAQIQVRVVYSGVVYTITL